MTKKFLLTEIGFETSVEDEKSLIVIAEYHRGSYDDERMNLSKISTLKQAINYFNNYGFTVTEIK